MARLEVLPPRQSPGWRSNRHRRAPSECAVASDGSPDLNLGREARAVLEEDRSGRTRTEIVLEAIEATYEQIVTAHGRQRSGLLAAAGRPAERRQVDEARKVAVPVSEAEAEILAEVLAQTTLSLSAFVDEALRLTGRRPT
jgi:hypothetical protein